ncbi:MAG: hypothetical protein HY769_05985 [Candidatus Stahlbacteria bacterium]|nr:hypothetical protein [Candidatus Stahlbacteria bacterium]
MGTIIDLRPFGLPYEPTVKEIVDTGIDLVCFSGDKLLGGPQAGIIVGKKELIMRIKKNPLYRILRVGKHILCLLEQVIRVYLYDTPLCGEPLSKLPHLFMMTEPLSSVKSRADKLCAGLSPIMGKEFTLSVVESLAEIGGGSYPGVVIPSFAVAISSNKHTVEKSRLSRSIGGFGGADKILASLRSCLPPIVARIVENKVLLDAKTIFPDEISQIVEAVAKSLKVKSSITG